MSKTKNTSINLSNERVRTYEPYTSPTYIGSCYTYSKSQYDQSALLEKLHKTIVVVNHPTQLCKPLSL